MSVFTSFAGGNLNVSISGSGTPLIARISMPLAATEYSYTFPDGTKQFLIKLVNAQSLQVTYVSGDSSTNYLTVPRTCFYAESDLDLTSKSIYFQCPVASQTVEILAWIS